MQLFIIIAAFVWIGSIIFMWSLCVVASRADDRIATKYGPVKRDE